LKILKSDRNLGTDRKKRSQFGSTQGKEITVINTTKSDRSLIEDFKKQSPISVR
jgi:hypothetical protein